MTSGRSSRAASLALVAAMVIGVVGGFVAGGRDGMLEVAFPLLLSVPCVELLRSNHERAPVIVPIAVGAMMVARLWKSGPGPGTIAGGALLFLSLILACSSGRRGLSILATVTCCAYGSVLGAGWLHF